MMASVQQWNSIQSLNSYVNIYLFKWRDVHKIVEKAGYKQNYNTITFFGRVLCVHT